MDAERRMSSKRGTWRGRRALTRASAVLCAIALALGVSGGATAQEPTTPYGWHDGDAGVVTTAWQCSAFGWAVDPENRDRDLQIQILADGNPVATTVADLPREGLPDCTGGTCGFAVNLWGLITPGIEHEITAQAYDEETFAWVDLWGTPKLLTCWGYPEGFHDGAQGTVDQSSCTASGWTADPDDRNRDLQVQIRSDGNPLPTVTADQLREDVTACVGGTCGFSADLWGLIDPDVEHAITAQAYDEESGQWLNLEATPKSLTCQAAPPPTPSIWISTSNDYLRANDFTPEATLTFRVYASEGEADPFLELSLTTDDFGYAFIDGWEHGSDLVVGNYIVASDGTSTRTLVLEPLTVDVFDPATDYVAGTASPGEFVHVVIGNNDVGYPAEMDVYANGEGEWQADFAGIFDIPWDMWGSADVFDEDGDRTVFHLGTSPPPSPRFSVFPEWEWIEGFDWPDDVPVYTSVDGKPECDDSASASGGYFHLELGEDCDIVVGDTVRLSDGTTDRMHIVRNLAITATDAEADTVAGTADVGAVVYVWKHEPGEQVAATADASGNWLADLTGFYDIVPGSEGRSEIRDPVGNGTAVDWYVPNPRFTVFPEWEFFDGLDWPDGATVTITVAGKAECEATRQSWGGFFNGNFGEGCDVEVGDTVTFTDGATTRTHVVRNLTVTSVDETDDTVAGTADEGEVVYVWPHETGQQLFVTVGASGAWQVDFTEQYDILAGSAGRAQIPDESGNATAVDWSVPSPWLTAFPEWDFVEGFDWPMGASVHLTIEDPVTELSPDIVRDDTAEPSPWGDPRTYVAYDLVGAFDLKPGDVITLTDGATARTMVVQYLTITGVDEGADSVVGTADPGAIVNVWPHETGEQIPVETAADGVWRVAFGEAYNIVAGSGGRAEIRDEYYNGTAVDWYVPIPKIIVQITDDWIWAQNYTPNSTVTFSVYEGRGGALLIDPAPTVQSDENGEAFLGLWDDLDVVSGNHVVVTDGMVTHELTIEAVTYDLLDLTDGSLTGTAPEPYGRTVSLGLGFPLYDWGTEVASDGEGRWAAAYGGPIPMDLHTAYAQVFDEDGDVSEVRPARIEAEVGIDIRPWSGTNLVWCRATWDLLPVAVLSEDGFDATAIDHDTVRFGRTGVEAAVASLAGRPLRYARDVNGDGLRDMVYTFRFGDTGFSCADIPLGQHSARVEATLSGWMGDIHLEGTDTLTLIRVLGH